MLQSKKNIPNLTVDERLALRNPKRNTEVVIREADKGSSVVVMSHERYIAEANRQLSDTDVYQQVSSAVVFDVIEEVKDILSRLQKSGVITEDMATYAVPVDSKPARCCCCCCCRPHSTNVLPAESSTRNHVAASSLSPQVARKGSTLSGFVQRSRLEREVGRDLHSNKWEEV